MGSGLTPRSTDIRRISDLYFLYKDRDPLRCRNARSGETAMPNTVRLHRVLATKPDKVYRAFIEADAIAKWLPPNGFTCTVHHFDAKVGGTTACHSAISPRA